MGLPLYVARSPSPESDTQTKRREKIASSSRSIRRRARIDDLARDSERERSRRRQRAVFIANYMSERGGDDEQSRQEVPQLSNVRPWGSSDLSPRHHRRSWERPDAERQRRIEDRVREQARDQAAHEQGLLSNLQRDQFDPISADHDGDSGATVAVLRRRVGAGILDGVRRSREARRARDAQQPHASTTTSGTSGSRQVTFGFDPWELYLMQTGRIAEAEALMSGLRDRNRSLFQSPGPDEDDDNNEAWDTLLTTLTPDPQPPSAGSSFASATATSQNSTRSASSNRLPASTHDCGGVCEICARARASSASAYPRLILRPDFGREPSRLGDSGFSGDGPRAAVSYTFSERRRHWRQMRDFAREIRSDSVERYTERIIDELNRIERRGGIIPDGTPLSWRPPLATEEDRLDGFEDDEDDYGELIV